MTDYGVTPEGFVIKPLEVILKDLEDNVHAVPGLEDLNMSPEAVGGKLAGPFADVVRKLWELGGGLYTAFDPSQAIGAQQDAVNALRGVPRLGARKGTVGLLLTLAPGAKVLAGKGIAQVQGQPGNRWILTETAENTTAGTTQITANAEAEFTGPTSAAAGTITSIASPAVGWSAVTNMLDAEPGRAIETNPEYRIRAEQETQKPGTSPLESVIAAVKKVKGVVRVFGFENTQDHTDADGVPPHCIEVVVQGGTDADLARCIWQSKGGGIGTHSSNTPKNHLDVVDTNGQTRTVYWTRPTIRTVYLRFTLSKKTTYPGDTAFKAAIAAWFDANVGAGDTLRYADAVCRGNDQPGVGDVAVTLGFAPSPVGTSNLAVLPREIADVDTSRIVVLP